MVQRLGFRVSTAGAEVQSLVGELGSHKLHGVAKKKNPQEPSQSNSIVEEAQFICLCPLWAC